VAPDVAHGIASTLQTASLGPIRPNLALFGWHGEVGQWSAFLDYLGIASQMEMSIVLLRAVGLPRAGRGKRVDVWWRGRKNGALMLLLAHLMSRNWEWAGAQIRVLRRVENQAGRSPALKALRDLIEHSRLHAEAEIVVSDQPFYQVLHEHSATADCVFLGLELPAREQLEAWHEAYERMMESLPTVILVQSSGRVDLFA